MQCDARKFLLIAILTQPC